MVEIRAGMEVDFSKVKTGLHGRVSYAYVPFASRDTNEVQLAYIENAAEARSFSGTGRVREVIARKNSVRDRQTGRWENKINIYVVVSNDPTAEAGKREAFRRFSEAVAGPEDAGIYSDLGIPWAD